MENNKMVVFDEVKAEVAKYKVINASLDFDYADPQGEKDARSHVFKLRKVKGKIEEVRKLAKAKALAHCKAVDAEGRFLTEETVEMIDVHMNPINEIAEKKLKAEQERIEAEQAEKARIEQERLDAITKQEEELARKQAELKAKEEEAQKEAERLVRENEKLEAAKQTEIDAKNREQQARKDAEEKAEQDKKLALEQAEEEKQEAIEAEKEKAREVEAERIAKEEAEKAEAKAKEDKRLAEEKIKYEAERKRVANFKHRKQIEDYASEDIDRFTDDSNMADKILEAIKAGEISNVTINY